MPWRTNFRGETFVLDQHGRLEPINERHHLIPRREAERLAKHLADSARAHDEQHEPEPVITRIIRDELDALAARRTASQQENTNHA